MIKVYVTKQANYPISAPKIKNNLALFLANKGIVSDAEVSVALVGEEKIKLLSKKYLNEKGGEFHNVLSFPQSETTEKFLYPDNLIHLGEIVVCFPLAVREASEEGKLIEEKVLELVKHGALHLLGQHHD